MLPQERGNQITLGRCEVGSFVNCHSYCDRFSTNKRFAEPRQSVFYVLGPREVAVLGRPTKDHADAARINAGAVKITAYVAAGTAEGEPDAELRGLWCLVAGGIPAGTDLTAERRITAKLPDHVVDHVAVAVAFVDVVVREEFEDVGSCAAHAGAQIRPVAEVCVAVVCPDLELMRGNDARYLGSSVALARQAGFGLSDGVSHGWIKLLGRELCSHRLAYHIIGVEAKYLQLVQIALERNRAREFLPGA